MDMLISDAPGRVDVLTTDCVDRVQVLVADAPDRVDVSLTAGDLDETVNSTLFKNAFIKFAELEVVTGLFRSFPFLRFLSNASWFIQQVSL